MGPTHSGFEFLKGNFVGLKGYAVGQMTKSRRGKLYIDDAGWGPEAVSIEYRYRVPFGGIHIFIGKIGELGPEPGIADSLPGHQNPSNSTSTGLGFYLHRKGPNQYKLLVSLVMFNPFKLTSLQWLHN